MTAGKKKEKDLKLMVNHNDTTLISWYAESEDVAKSQLKTIKDKFGLKVV